MPITERHSRNWAAASLFRRLIYFCPDNRERIKFITAVGQLLRHLFSIVISHKRLGNTLWPPSCARTVDQKKIFPSEDVSSRTLSLTKVDTDDILWKDGDIWSFSRKASRVSLYEKSDIGFSRYTYILHQHIINQMHEFQENFCFCFSVKKYILIFAIYLTS